MKQYEVKTIALPNGESYAYRCTQSGEKTLILIHGNLSSSVHWQTTMEALEGEYKIYAPDLRGFGLSSYNAQFNSLSELARDMEQFIDALGITDYYLCGWSTGGGVAMELAAANPDRVKGLVLLDSVPPTGFPMFKKGPDFQPILTQPLKTKEEVAADPVQVVPTLQILSSNDREKMRGLWNLTIYNLNQPPAADYEIYLDSIMLQRNLVDVVYSLMSFDFTSKISQVVCPVTVMSGEKDIVVPLAWSQQTHKLFGESAKMVIFPNSGHSAVTDEPDAFFAALKEAL